MNIRSHKKNKKNREFLKGGMNFGDIRSYLPRHPDPDSTPHRSSKDERTLISLNLNRCSKPFTIKYQPDNEILWEKIERLVLNHLRSTVEQTETYSLWDGIEIENRNNHIEIKQASIDFRTIHFYMSDRQLLILPAVNGKKTSNPNDKRWNNLLKHFKELKEFNDQFTIENECIFTKQAPLTRMCEGGNCTFYLAVPERGKNILKVYQINADQISAGSKSPPEVAAPKTTLAAQPRPKRMNELFDEVGSEAPVKSKPCRRNIESKKNRQRRHKNWSAKQAFSPLSNLQNTPPLIQAPPQIPPRAPPYPTNSRTTKRKLLRSPPLQPRPRPDALRPLSSTLGAVPGLAELAGIHGRAEPATSATRSVRPKTRGEKQVENALKSVRMRLQGDKKEL